MTMEERDPSVPVCGGRRAVAHEPTVMEPIWVCPVCGEENEANV